MRGQRPGPSLTRVSRFLEVGPDQAAGLIAAQFPHWAALELQRVLPGGSDHVIYRLGEELTVRFPRHAGPIEQAQLEAGWLPRLAPHLPLAIPEPVAVGEPADGYPWHWAVSGWLDGEPVTVAEYGESTAAAETLAGFALALQRFPVGPDAPAPRPLRLSDRDAAIRERICRVGDTFDPAELTRLWDAGLAAPAWDRDPVWYHGDFHTGNLLAAGGRISAVLDFGSLGIGDPANDLMMAFTLFSPGPRAAFRYALDVDEATWLRGRAIALAAGLTAYTAYAATNPQLKAATTRQILAAVAG